LQASGVGRGVRVRIYTLGELDSSIGEPWMSYCDAKDAQEGKEEADYAAHAEESLAMGRDKEGWETSATRRAFSPFLTKVRTFNMSDTEFRECLAISPCLIMYEWE